MSGSAQEQQAWARALDGMVGWGLSSSSAAGAQAPGSSGHSQPAFLALVADFGQSAVWSSINPHHNEV